VDCSTHRPSIIEQRSACLIASVPDAH
jgi:hypothetical protein